MENIRADVFLMGMTGVHPQTGLTTGDFEEAEIKRALSQLAAETYVLASNEKLNAASSFRVLALSQIIGIIVEGDAEQSLVASCVEQGLTIVRA